MSKLNSLTIYTKYNAEDFKFFCTHVVSDCPLGLLDCPFFEEENVSIEKCESVTEEMWNEVLNNSIEKYMDQLWKEQEEYNAD